MRTLALALLFACAAHAAAAQALGVEGARLTIGGAPRFLLFVSYFDAMRRVHAGDIDTDLRYFKEHGYDGIRMFPNWWHYACEHRLGPADAARDGLFTTTILPPVADSRWINFAGVLERASLAGLVVDVTFTRETIAGTAEGVALDRYTAQIVEVARRLKGTYANVLFDLQNEFPRNGLTARNIQTIASAVRREDPARLMTASTASGIDDAQAAGRILVTAGLALAAVHTPRGANWFADAT